MKARFMNFMRGRYGNDELNICLLVLSIVFSLLSPLVKIFSSLSLVFILFAFFRMFSKNIAARQAENNRVAPYIAFFKAKFKNKGTARIFMCKKCKRTLRVPKGHGNITVKCPCGNMFKRKS